MNDQLLQEVLKRIDKIGAIAAEGGKEAFHQLVQIQRFDAIVGMTAWVAIGLAISIIGRKMAKRNQKIAEDTSLPEYSVKRCRADYRALVTLSYAACAFGILIIILAMACNLRSIVMPEATLIQSLLNRSL